MAANDCQSQRRWMLMLTRATQWTLDCRSGKSSRCSLRSLSWAAGSEEGSLGSYWNTMTACGECSERRWFQHLRFRSLPRAGHIENFVTNNKGSEMAQNQEQSPAKKCQGATFTVGGYSYKIGECTNKSWIIFCNKLVSIFIRKH